MKRIRYLSCLIVLLSVCPTLWAQSDFNPVNPSEPGQPPVRLVLLSSPADGGSTNGSGKYVPGTEVSIRAYNNTGWAFSGWTDTEGNVVSATSSFTHTMGEVADTLVANFKFSPGSPAEPKEPALTQYFKLSIGGGDGGYGSGGGSYLSGNSIYVSCYPTEGYDFCGWYNSSGELVSSTRSFYYVTTAQNEVLTPCFNYNPASPSEPSEPILQHDIVVEATEGGTASAYSYRLLEGSSTTLRAYTNTGYKFVRWLKDGEPYTELSTFTYTMEKADVTFRAEFVFDPGNPSEPSMPTDKLYAFYLMSKIAKPGDLLQYPVYLTALDTLCDMNFQLTFPPQLKPDLSSLSVSEKAEGYSVSYATVNDTCYAFTLIGGKTEPGNTLLLRFNVPVPDTLTTGLSHQVKINQVSITRTDGSSLTASTRNGRIYVYKRGDTNGDGDVNLLDSRNMVLYILGEETEVFIPEVSDMNDDSLFNLIDCKGIVDVILNETE